MTIGEIAEALGVSKTTVSRAISGKGRVGQETRDRIQAYIKECNYKPNAYARGLAKSRTYNIGVVMPREHCLSDMPFFLNCLDGIHEVTSAIGYDILLVLCDNDNLSSLERIIDNQKVDGVVLMRTFLEDKSVAFLKKAELPFITIGSTQDKDVAQIDQNHESGCMELTSILLAKGMQRIGLIGGNEEYVVTQKRLNGYRNAFLSMHCAVDEGLIFQNQINAVMIESTVDQLLKKKVDCIISMDDNICKTVLDKLHKEHVKVPDQVKVASFFNSTILEDHEPSITSLSFDSRKTGTIACQTLVDMIKGNEVSGRNLLGYEVVLKESTK